MGALPIPERGGNIQELRRFTNLSDENFILFVAVLADALYPGRPHVLLNLVGGSGSGKTTAAKIVRSVVDPSEVAVGTLPREVRDLFVDVNSSHVFGI
jgi:ABC-type phosphonate transport system ATPase subunit